MRSGCLHVLAPDTGSLQQTVQPDSRSSRHAKSEPCFTTWHKDIIFNFISIAAFAVLGVCRMLSL